MTDDIGNRKTCYLVYEDRKRDYSAVEKFGDTKIVFSSVGRDFVPSAAIDHARRVLSSMREDDYLVMSGDPALCAICVTVATEKFGRVPILRWDRNMLNYTQMTLIFD